MELTPVYATQTRWPDGIDHALVIHCSDPWYREAHQEFVAHHLQLAGYDPLVMPGGPTGLLNSSLSALPYRQGVRLLHGLHHFRKVVGIAHRNCAAYVERHPRLTPEERITRQQTDLLEFRRVILKLVPDVRVELYFAEGKPGQPFRFYELNAEHEERKRYGTLRSSEPTGR